MFAHAYTLPNAFRMLTYFNLCAILLTNLVAEMHLSVFIPAFIDILPQLNTPPPTEFKKHSIPLTLALKCDIVASEP